MNLAGLLRMGSRISEYISSLSLEFISKARVWQDGQGERELRTEHAAAVRVLLCADAGFPGLAVIQPGALCRVQEVCLPRRLGQCKLRAIKTFTEAQRGGHK